MRHKGNSQGFKERKNVLIAFLLFYIIGVPVWWKTTEIYRSNLPHEQITTLSEDQFFFPWKISIDLIVLGQVNDQVADRTKKDLQEALITGSRSNSLSYTPEWVVTVSKNASRSIDQLATLTDNNAIDEWIHSTLQPQSTNGKYQFYVIPSTSNSEVFLGKYRHGWVKVSNMNDLSSVIPKIAAKCKKYFVSTESNSQSSGIAVRPSPEYRLSFSLLNANPGDHVVTWDFAEASRRYLSPFLEVLQQVAEVSVDSQVIQYATLGQTPSFDSRQSTHYLTESSLPHFVNNNEWKLDFTDTKTHPMLNFIFYVPSKSETPLKIKLDDGSFASKNAFSFPQWGGIVVYNPPSDSKHIHLSGQDLLPSMQLFISQLRGLFGIPQIDNTVVPATESGIAQWEVDSLMRRNTFYNVNSSMATLKSLSKLVQNMTNMVVLDNIETLCSTSINSLEKTSNALSTGNYSEAFVTSREAFKSSEEAFFDPNMLALLYFPNEHKYAIYALPFLPITFQLFSGIYGEYKVRNQIKKRKVD